MKKIATLAVLAAISSVAAAQSSVTLFGVVDEAARYVDNGGNHIKSLASGGLNTSRIGFRGTEDLGGGLRAGFWLEAGIGADTGSTGTTGGNAIATQFFNRRSTVSLISNFGELRLGRDYTPTYLGYTDYDTFGDNGLAAAGKFDASNLFGGYTSAGVVVANPRLNYARSSNQIMYLLPTGIGGVYGRVAVAAAEGSSVTNGGTKYGGGRIGYGAGPLDVSVSYGQTSVAPLRGDNKFKVADVGASYDFGVIKPMAYYTQTKFAGQKVATASIGALVPVGALSQLKAQYTHVDQSGTNAAGTSIDGNDAQQLAVGYIYNLSKRTALYSTAAYVKNKGRARFAIDSNPAFGSGSNSKGIEAGIRHAF